MAAIVVAIGVSVDILAPSSTARVHKVAAPTYPKVWDPRIAPLAAIAEKDRGLKFLRPIYVEFVPGSRFDKLVTTTSPTAFQKARLKRESEILRSIGLMSDSDDLLASENEANRAGVLAFYSFETKRAYIRGTVLTANVKVTLVHELTHALQDQHFDVSRTAKQVTASAGASYLAYSSLLEGDARRVEFKYEASLPRAQRDQILAVDKAEFMKASTQAGDVPPYIGAVASATYDLGALAVTRAFDAGGTARVNALFAHPPMQDIQMMDPWLEGAAWRQHSVRAPSFNSSTTYDPGTTRAVAGQLGAFTLYLMLAQRVPIPAALRAAEQWGNDALVVRDTNTGPCIRDNLVGQSAAGSKILASALRAWAQGSQGSATVSTAGGTLTLAACDPGPLTYAAPDHTFDAFFALSHRNAVEALIERHGRPLSQGLCFADADIATFSVQTLLGFDQNRISPAQRERLGRIAQRCYG